MGPRRFDPSPTLDQLAKRFGRRDLAKHTGLIAAGMLLGRADLLRSSAQTTPEIALIINDLATLEACSTTFYGVARAKQDAANYSDDVKRLARSAQCQDQAHYNFFLLGSATAQTTNFTLAASLFATQDAFLTAAAEIEAISVAAHMAAARACTELGAVDLVEILFQVGTVDAQQRALARSYLELRPPNDRAFSEWRFFSTADAVEALVATGWIDGRGETFAYPGPVEVNCKSILGLVPNTTSNELATAHLDKHANPSGFGDASPAASGGATPAAAASPLPKPDG